MKKIDEFRELLDVMVDDLVSVEPWMVNGIVIFQNMANYQLLGNKCCTQFLENACPVCQVTITKVCVILRELVYKVFEF